MAGNIFTEREIESLIEQFETGILPKVEWTHQAHIVVAVWYSNKFDESDALTMVRNYIRKHNESVGTPNTDTGGYHETITIFWLWVAKMFLAKRNSESIVRVCNDLIDSKFSERTYPLSYYSKELLFSTEARHTWIEPDIQPLRQLIEY